MKLKLESFGFFKNTSFPIGQVTIFFGPNETGKTTLFDALVSSIIKITGSTSFGKKLRDRYGDSRSAELESSLLEISSSKFLNSYAIREGKVRLDDDSKDNKELISSIQKSLFDSGFDSKNLTNICNDRSSTKKSVKSGKDLKIATEEYEEKFKLWKNAEEERLNTLSKWSNLPKKEKEKNEIGDSLKKKEANLASLKSQIEQLTAKSRHHKAKNLFQSLLSFEAKKEAVGEMRKWFSEGRDKSILKLNDDIKSLQLNQKVLQKKQIEASEKLTSVQRNIGQLSPDKETSASLEGIVFEIEKKLDSLISENAPQLVLTEWKMEFLLLGSFLLLSGLLTGIITFFKSYPGFYYILTGILFFGGITILTNFSRKITITRDQNRIEKDILSLAEELILRTSGKVSPLLKTRDGIKSAISKYRETDAVLAKDLEREKKQEQEIQQSLTSLGSDILKSTNELSELQSLFQSSLAEIGAKNLEEVQNKISEAKAEEQSFQTLRLQIEAALKENQLVDASELKVSLKDQIQSFEKSMVPFDFTTEDKNLLRNITLQFETEKEDYDRLKEKYFSLDTALSGELGGSRIQIKDILEKCDHTRKEKEEAEKKLNLVKATMKAYETLAGIFTEMGEGSENQILTLVKSLKKRWNEILPEDEIRNIDWNHFGEVPKVYDKFHQFRDVDHLSTGTKELFYFSLRIEYALRMSKEDNVKWLLLDEPFRHMDATRMDSAVKYTLNFLKREGWTGVFFTFDNVLKEEIIQNAKELELDCILNPLT